MIRRPPRSTQSRSSAASDVYKRQAYEHPVHRHGLLTKALIDVLTRTGGTVSLVAAMDEAQDIIRADAAAMGITQTPILFGMIDGGLKLPALRRGGNFQKAFPETIAVRVTADIHDLAAAGISKAVLDAWAERFPDGLNDLQIMAVNEYQILNRSSAVSYTHLTLPTIYSV